MFCTDRRHDGPSIVPDIPGVECLPEAHDASLTSLATLGPLLRLQCPRPQHRVRPEQLRLHGAQEGDPHRGVGALHQAEDWEAYC